jgi:hypothetical protein
LVVDPLYLQHSFSEKSIDYRHWGIPLSRRFRALKLWFVIRIYGVEGLRAYIREHCRLAKVFESYVLKDDRFEIMNKVQLGLVCFRLKGSNTLNQKLLSTINASGKIHMVPASLNDKYVIRFCVCRETAKDADMEYAWKLIAQFAGDVMELDKKASIPSISADSPPGSPIPSPTPTPGARRPSQEVIDLFKELNLPRRQSLAKQTALLNDIVGRASIDLGDDETMTPRSRSGSLFPVSSFVDDFPQAGRNRSGSILPEQSNLQNVFEESHSQNAD